MDHRQGGRHVEVVVQRGGEVRRQVDPGDLVVAGRPTRSAARATKPANRSQVAPASTSVSSVHSSIDRYWTAVRAYRTTAAGVRSSTDETSRLLPSDLLILVPPWVTQPLCSQYRANPYPAARDCACSFSWCGNRRSSPPPWMSNVSPR